MKFTITNFHAIKFAEILIKKITLLAGINEQGKTSILEAIASATTTNVLPFPELTKTQAGMVVHTGTDGAEVVLQSETGEAIVRYPECKKSVTGSPIEISDYSAGLKSIVDLKTKSGERGKALNELIKANPTLDDLKKELPDMNLERLWQAISVQGWDAAHEQAQNVGRTLKAKWEAVTGTNFGEKIAAEWVPDAYSFALRSETTESLTAKITAAQCVIEGAILNTAISDEKIEGLRTVVATLPGLRADLKKISDTLHGMLGRICGVEGKIAEALPVDVGTSIPCPHCSKPLRINGKFIVTAEESISPEELKARKDILDALDKEHGTQQHAIDESNKIADDLNKKITIAENAETELKKAEKQAKKSASVNMDELHCTLEKAKSDLNAFTLKAQADSGFKNIQMNKQIVDVLSPKGLRFTVLKKALGEFNSKLATACKTAKWKTITIAEDTGIYQAGIPYTLLSMSAKWRVRCVLQVVMAAYSGDKLLLIDEAGMLDKPGRNGLFALLSSCSDAQAVVAMTLLIKEDVPAVEKMGWNSFWIENGEVK